MAGQKEALLLSTSGNGGHIELSLSPSEYPWEMGNRVVLR